MTAEADLKGTIDDIGRRFEEFKAANNAALKKGVQDALAEANIERLGQAIDDLTGQKSDLEKRIKLEREEREALERKFNVLALTGTGKPVDAAEVKATAEFNQLVQMNARQRQLSAPGEIDLEGYRAYKRAFDKFLRRADSHLTADEVKTMQVAIDSDGGFWVPPDTGGRIVTKLYELSPVRQIANVQTISSDKLEGVEDLGEAGGGWLNGERVAPTTTTTPSITRWEIPVHWQYAEPKVTQQLLDDAVVDVESWLAAKVADKLARLEAAAFITGNGIGQPRGFTTYTTAATADGSRSWGQFEHITTGVNADFPTTQNNPSDKLIDLEAAFKPAYLNGAAWVMPRAVQTKIRKFKDGNGIYIWQPGLSVGAPVTLIGYPVVMMQDMPALATGSLSLALGNFKVGYQIVDRMGIRVLRDPLTAKPYVKFFTTRRTGGGVVNFEAIKFLNFTA